MTEGGRIKHYMIDQTPDGQYQVVGNRKLFRWFLFYFISLACLGSSLLTVSCAASLNALVEYHHTHNIVSNDPVCLLFPCGQVILPGGCLPGVHPSLY